MPINAAQFTPVTDSRLPWALMVTIEGSGFEHTAVPYAGRVGETFIEWLIPKPDSTGLIGFLGEEPERGAELMLGHLGHELIGTGFTYQPPVT